MPSNLIVYGNPRFIEAYIKISNERPDEEQIIEAALQALEGLRTRIHEADWKTQKILSILKERSNGIFDLGIGYESFLVSLRREKTGDPETPYIITALTMGPAAED